MSASIRSPFRLVFAVSAMALLIAALSTTPLAAPPPGSATGIVSVVNGEVITNADVSSRGRLFALSTGMAITPEVLTRLRPQITRQLIEERLRLQETQRRHIVVQDKEIATAIREIEARNNLPVGALRQRLAADGTGMRTLIDQIRAQIGWTLVLRQQIGERIQVTPTEIEKSRSCRISRRENPNSVFWKFSFRSKTPHTPPTLNALPKPWSANCARARHSKSLPRSSARVRPPCKAAILAGCRKTGSTRRCFALPNRCPWVPSATP